MTVAETIIGREEELERITRCLGSLPCVVLLEGEPGIGKTTLWRAASDARARELLVLRATPSEAESQLAFSAAADLLAPVADDEALEDLPVVQRRALDAAVLLESHGTADRRVVATAFLGLLRRLAARNPLLLAVDDLQWVDADSALLLGFAARRLGSEPIGFLLVRRSEGAEPQLELGESVQRVEITPLSLGALGRVIHTRTGAPLSRPLLRRIHEISGGNPFFALELASVADDVASTHDIALPTSLAALVEARLRRLPRETRAALAELAALPERVSGDPDPDAIAPALDGDVVKLTREGVEFTHPLLRAAAYGQLTPARRRQLHQRLAETVGDVEQRAHHLARATHRPDEAVAAAIEEGAERAKARGAPAVAAELLDRAIELTEAEELRVRRVLDATTWKAEAGEMDAARAALEAQLADLAPGQLRAEVLATLTDDIGVEVGPAVALAEEGLAQPGIDTATRARLLLVLSDTVFLQNDIRRSAEHAREALALAETTDNGGLLARATSWNGQLVNLTASGDPTGFFDRARRLEQRRPGIDPWHSAGHWQGLSLMWADRVSEARALLEEQYERSVELGNEAARAGLCFHLTQLECRAGQLPAREPLCPRRPRAGRPQRQRPARRHPPQRARARRGTRR